MPRSPTWWCFARTPKTSTRASNFPTGSAEVHQLIYFLQNELKATGIRFPASSGIGIKPVSKEGSQRLVRKAIQYAIENDRVSVSLVHKGNIMKFFTAVPGRRSPRIRRASAGLTPVRAAALLVVLASAAAIYGVSASSAFVAKTLSIEGATWTGEDAVRETVGALQGANLFTLRTADLESRLVTLPAVRSALVSVTLPDAIGIRLEERTPLLVWQTGADRWLVDREGLVFAKLGDDPPPEAAGLAVVEDARPASVAPGRQPARPGRARRGAPTGLAHPGRRRQQRAGAAHPARRYVGLRAPYRHRRLVRRVRLLHADAALDRADRRPGPAPAQLPRGPRADGVPDHPRGRPERDVHPAGHPPAVGRRLASPSPSSTP